MLAKTHKTNFGLSFGAAPSKRRGVDSSSSSSSSLLELLLLLLKRSLLLLLPPTPPPLPEPLLLSSSASWYPPAKSGADERRLVGRHCNLLWVLEEKNRSVILQQRLSYWTCSKQVAIFDIKLYHIRQ